MATLILPLVTGPWILRALQPNAFGQYALALAIVEFGIIIVDFGFLLSATQHIAAVRDDKVEVTKYFWTVQAARLMLMLLSGAVILALIFSVPRFHAIHSVVALYLPVLVGTLMFPQWLFLGLGRVRAVSLLNITARLLLLPLIFILVTKPSDAGVAAIIAAGSYLISGILSTFFIIRWGLLSGFIRPRLSSIWMACKDSWPLFLANIAFSLYSTCNTVILGAVKDDYAVGLFSAADKLRFAAQTPTRAISTVFFPRVSRAISLSRPKALTLMAGLTLALTLIGVLTCSFLYLFSSEILHLFAGSTFGDSVSVLEILSFVCILVSVNTALGTLGMVNLGLKKQFSRIVVSCGVVNVILLLFLARSYGANGAAVSLLVTEICVGMLMLATLVRHGVVRDIYFALRGTH